MTNVTQSTRTIDGIRRQHEVGTTAAVASRFIDSRWFWAAMAVVVPSMLVVCYLVYFSSDISMQLKLLASPTLLFAFSIFAYKFLK